MKKKHKRHLFNLLLVGFWFLLVALFVPLASMRQAAGETASDAVILGNRAAEVKIIEYISLTCSHCANFHRNVFPQLKEKYIDSGLISFEMRDFPLDGLALKGAILARCREEGPARLIFIDNFLKNQRKWIAADDPLGALNGRARQLGLSDKQIKQCYENQDLIRRIILERTEASEKYKVRATPSIVLNDKLVDGTLDFDHLSREIDAILP